MCFVSAPLARVRNNSSKSFRGGCCRVPAAAARRSCYYCRAGERTFPRPSAATTLRASKLFNSIYAPGRLRPVPPLRRSRPAGRSLFRFLHFASSPRAIQFVQPTEDTLSGGTTRGVYELRHVPGTDTRTRDHSRLRPNNLHPSPRGFAAPRPWHMLGTRLKRPSPPSSRHVYNSFVGPIDRFGVKPVVVCS